MSDSSDCDCADDWTCYVHRAWPQLESFKVVHDPQLSLFTKLGYIDMRVVAKFKPIEYIVLKFSIGEPDQLSLSFP